ncbi:class I SAM-dependent methyltransferase [Methylobacterium sp. JK268]
MNWIDTVVDAAVGAAVECLAPAPVLIVGAPKQVTDRLRDHGYLADGVALPSDAWRDADWAKQIGVTQVVLALLDPTVARDWAARLSIFTDSSVETLIICSVSRDAVAPWRAMIEDAAFRAGFRKHPAFYRVNPYDDIDRGRLPILTPLVRVPGAADEDLGGVARHLMPHADLSRETGRRSDAHLYRYQLASTFVQPRDRVVEIGSGVGAGAWMLARITQAISVTAFDESGDAVAYARRTFADEGGRLSYAVGDAEDLAGLEPNSVDLIVSFGVVAHRRNPETFLRRCLTILRPGGRLVVGVPNRCVDKTTRDAGPHTRHAYDWERILAEVGAHFIIDGAFAQDAGDDAMADHRPRRCFGIDPHDPSRPDSEWCLVVGVKSPVGCEAVPFDDGRLGPHGIEGWSMNDFAQHYVNPWGVTAVGSHGLLRPWRVRDGRSRRSLAGTMLDTVPAGSPDEAACLAAIGYAALEAPVFEADHNLVARIERCVAALGQGPIAVRWRISLIYLKARLLQIAGDRDAARAAYRECVDIEPLAYGPSIATKTICAWKRLGTMWFLEGCPAEAERAWLSGVDVARRILDEATWVSAAASVTEPDAVGLYELYDVFSLAHECALLLSRMRAAPAPSGFLVQTESLTRDGVLRSRQRQLDALGAEIGAARETLQSLRRILNP